MKDISIQLLTVVSAFILGIVISSGINIGNPDSYIQIQCQDGYKYKGVAKISNNDGKIYVNIPDTNENHKTLGPCMLVWYPDKLQGELELKSKPKTN